MPRQRPSDRFGVDAVAVAESGEGGALAVERGGLTDLVIAELACRASALYPALLEMSRGGGSVHAKPLDQHREARAGDVSGDEFVDLGGSQPPRS